MNENRIAQLKALVAEYPADPFPIYALALEYVADQPDEAKFLFDRLLMEHPEYVPVYYQAAHFYIVHRQAEKAKEIIGRGIEKAVSSRDFKTRAELESLLDSED